MATLAPEAVPRRSSCRRTRPATRRRSRQRFVGGGSSRSVVKHEECHLGWPGHGAGSTSVAHALRGSPGGAQAVRDPANPRRRARRWKLPRSSPRARAASAQLPPVPSSALAIRACLTSRRARDADRRSRAAPRGGWCAGARGRCPATPRSRAHRIDPSGAGETIEAFCAYHPLAIPVLRRLGLRAVAPSLREQRADYSRAQVEVSRT